MYTPSQRVLQVIWGIVFIVAGLGHFLFSTKLSRFIPPYLPGALALVLISGILEIAGGVGLILRRFRRAAGWGLSAMLVSFLPANVFMGMSPVEAGLPGVPAIVFWTRVAILPPMVWCMLWCTQARSPLAVVDRSMLR
jgi:uncharacterized membrane protein